MWLLWLRHVVFPVVTDRIFEPIWLRIAIVRIVSLNITLLQVVPGIDIIVENAKLVQLVVQVQRNYQYCPSEQTNEAPGEQACDELLEEDNVEHVLGCEEEYQIGPKCEHQQVEYRQARPSQRVL